MGVINAVQWASVLRDDVAHGAVFKVNEQGHFHLPPDYNTKRTFALSAMPVAGAFTWAKYHYVAAQIVDISAKFTALRHAILDYEDDVIARSKDRTII
ncbi:MAG: hypothetical protein JWN71_1527 [Xanthobacteraceae bacterium]|nr:hypothetical protein [Xanthobacteraceae bacterium]